MRSHKTVQMAETALMSAVLCILAPLAIPLPFSPVPLTMGSFAVYVTAAVLGPGKGTLSVALYLLLGMAGLPVFSGFSGGIGVLAGPTGGYVIGYIPCALLVGWLVGRYRCRTVGTIFAMVTGTIVCYVFGTAWVLIIMGGTYTLAQAVLVCIVPYLVFDAMKIVLAAMIAVEVRKRMKFV